MPTNMVLLLGPAVELSINQVLQAGRARDPVRVKQERARHRAFMANLPGRS
jgi:hypothetical protein